MMKAFMAGFVVLFLAAPVQAEPTDAPESPSGLQGEHDPETNAFKLSWLPPDNATYVYRVYEDAVLLANTTLTNITIPVSQGIHAYYVTATHAGVESRPSPPLLFHHLQGTYAIGNLPGFQLAAGGGGGGCEAIILHTDTQPPFVDVVIRKECLPPLPCTDIGPLAVRGTC